jgi:hypothetical protein
MSTNTKNYISLSLIDAELLRKRLWTKLLLLNDFKENTELYCGSRHRELYRRQL